LSERGRKDLAIQALAGSATISELASRQGVSRKFVRQQTRKATAALEEAFPTSASDDDEVLLNCRCAGAGCAW
jgi:hypothetical protein